MYPYGLLALELEQDIFKGRNWRYHPSNAYDIAAEEAEEFDKQFDFKKKEYRYTQELFSIACRAYIV